MKWKKKKITHFFISGIRTNESRDHFYVIQIRLYHWPIRPFAHLPRFTTAWRCFFCFYPFSFYHPKIRNCNQCQSRFTLISRFFLFPLTFWVLSVKRNFPFLLRYLLRRFFFSRRTMKLLTHNMLSSKCLKGVVTGYPLTIIVSWCISWFFYLFV